MSRLWIHTITCASAIAALALPQQACLPQGAANLVPNPGFEAPDLQREGGVDQWRNSRRTRTYSGWSAAVHSGQRCLHLRAEWDQEEASASSARIQVKGGQWYELSGWIRTRNVRVGQAFVKVDVYAGETRRSSTWLLRTGGTHGWKRLTAKIKAARDATHLFVCPYLYRSARDVWFDDLSLKETEPMKLDPMTDEELFQAVDLTRAHMAAVREAVEAKDYASARNALLESLRTFAPPKYLFDPTVRPTPDPDKPCPAADRVCRHELTFYDTTYKYPDHIYFNPSPPINDEHFVFYLNWTGFWATLVQAWWDTGREKYIDEWNREVLEWTKAFPQAGPQPCYPQMTWEGTRVALWTNLWYRTREATGFTEQARIAFLKSLVQQTRHLLTKAAPHPQLQSERSLFIVGLMFPQFRESREWMAAGIGRTDQMLEEYVYPDGAECELTTHYHQLPIAGAGLVIRLSEANGIELPKRMVETFDRLHEYYMWVAKPNGQTPQINDADIDHVRHYLENRGRETDRGDFLFVGTGGKEGTPPAESSHALPYAGQYVMRTGWDEDATYLILDAGPYGIGHQHHDALNIDLWAGGRSLIVDPGRYTYVRDKWRAFFTSAWSHNGIAVDAQVQNRSQEPGRIAWPLDNRWISLPGFDLAVGAHDSGFGPHCERTAHWTRWVVFRKPCTFVVLDVVQGDGERDLQQMWHFAPMEVAATPDGAVATANPSGGNLLLAPPQASGLKLDLVKGQDDPVQGWFSPRFRVKEPATTAIYSGRRALPFVFETVLATFTGTPRPTVRVRRLNTSSALTTALEIVGRDGRDVLILGHDDPLGEKRGGDALVAGELGWIALTPDGQPRSLLAVNARRVEVGGLRLLRSDGFVPQLEIDWGDDVIEIAGSLPAGAELLAAGRRRVLVNGKPVATEQAGDYLRLVGAPTAAPAISDVRVAPVAGPRDARDPYASLELTFRTDRPARGYALYGRHGIESVTQQEAALGLEHKVTLRNLRAGVPYAVRPAALAECLAVGEPVAAQAR